MDFALFMERYGYSILLLIIAIIIAAIIGVMAFYVYRILKVFGITLGGILLIYLFVLAFGVKRRALDAQARAHAKYFYDDRPRR
jgi:uncharacterized membrane protein